MILIRCDASAQLGVGHVMRCIALAEALRERGLRPCFVARAHGAVRHELAAREFELELLPQPTPSMHEPLGETDAAALRAIAVRTAASAIVVDHYGACDAYLRSLVRLNVPLGVVDDMADRDLSPCQWVLNPSPFATRLRYRVDVGAAMLLGPTFALLRKEFTETTAPQVCHKSGAARVLLTLGGGDQTQRLFEMSDALLRSARPLHIRCLSPDGGSLLARIGDAIPPRHQFEIVEHQRCVADVFSWAEVALTAGGTTCWELCALGVPQVIVALEANQRPNAEGIAATGCGLTVGDYEGSRTAGRAAHAIETLLADERLRGCLSARARAVVDGHGAARAAAVLHALALGRGGRQPGALSSRRELVEVGRA